MDRDEALLNLADEIRLLCAKVRECDDDEMPASLLRELLKKLDAFLATAKSEVTGREASTPTVQR